MGGYRIRSGAPARSSTGLCHRVPRLMKLRYAICLSMLGTLALVGAAPAAAETPFPPGGFRLPASNGYSLHALSFDGDPRGEHDELILFFGRKGAGATYFAL